MTDYEKATIYDLYKSAEYVISLLKQIEEHATNECVCRENYECKKDIRRLAIESSHLLDSRVINVNFIEGKTG